MFDVVYLLLLPTPTSADAWPSREHIQKQLRWGITFSSAFPMLGSTYCLLQYLAEDNDFTNIKVTYALNNLKLDGGPAEIRGQVSRVQCFIYTLRGLVRGFKLLSLTA